MSQPVVLVIFSCCTGETEALALRAAVGAVQGRALIRLRRLPDTGTEAACEALARMRREYVPPAEKDIRGADAIVLATPPNAMPESAELQNVLNLLAQYKDEKVLAGLGSSDRFINSLSSIASFVTLDDPLGLGRGVAEAARVARQHKEVP